MQSFLQEVVEEIYEKDLPLEDLIFVLPSKRAGTFLKNIIAKTTQKTVFAPEIYSIESFIEKISGLAYASSTEQLFTLYQAYLYETPKNRDDFFVFSKWGQTLLQDFNEIDRYLIDASKVFTDLTAIQELNHWSLQQQKTEMMQDYLQFWNNLEPLYHTFNDLLLQRSMGHQGLVYRKACDSLLTYLEKNKSKTFVFMGFNALNTAESTIVQHILATSKALIYWDIDNYFLSDKIHDAGYFLRRHLKEWPYLNTNPLKGISEFYQSKKRIEIIGMPKSVSQAKYTGQLLAEINKERPERLLNAAVVLGDETLLNPILNAIPKEIERVNITMGYPLGKTPMAKMFDDFIDLYIHKDEQGWFYSDLLSFLAHPYIGILCKASKIGVNALAKFIKEKNWAYIDIPKLSELTEGESPYPFLFLDKVPTPLQFINNCLSIIDFLRPKFQDNGDRLSLAYLYQFHNLFNQLSGLVQTHEFIADLKTLQSLFRELLSSENLDFQGEPLEGLQIMGMLESRNLDFETVIITSVNEGILPSGKSNNSFIPFDLKVHLGLPTYKEKDAVYTYHFYRLLQRAKYIYILYNTEPDVLEGGERSRLIAQLLTDDNKYLDITETIASPMIEPVLQTLEIIEKDVHLLELIKKHALSGFSPTSLSNYIRNPIDFYKRNLLQIDDVLEVEDTIAANTFGTIVHDTLEDLYRPFLGEYLSEKGLSLAKSKVMEKVKYQFSKSFFEGDISRGKNLIAFNVIVRYIENFLANEIREVKQHRIKLVGLETKSSISLKLPEINYPVVLKGKLDRIDEFDGILRIIDYKTGKVTSAQVEIVDWDEIILDYEYSKAFQLLCYALLYTGNNPFSEIEAGIFSFKNLNAGLLRFATKEKKGSRNKNHIIDQEILEQFSVGLRKLIAEICNPNIPFAEKEV